MDAWEPYAVREHCRDAVRAWAELEGKSPQMAEDLLRQRTEPIRRPRNWAGLALSVKLLAWAAEAWWQITRR
jgi:hypothetical protein